MIVYKWLLHRALENLEEMQSKKEELYTITGEDFWNKFQTDGF